MLVLSELRQDRGLAVLSLTWGHPTAFHCSLSLSLAAGSQTDQVAGREQVGEKEGREAGMAAWQGFKVLIINNYTRGLWLFQSRLLRSRY